MFSFRKYVQNKDMKYRAKMIIIIFIFMLFSLNNLNAYADGSVLLKQLLFFTLGFLLFLLISRIEKRKVFKWVFPLYIVLNVLLLYLLFFGNAINGSKAWLNFGFISFQPSEFMKITLIILLSLVVKTNDKYFLKTFLLVLIPSVLTFLEPDTGNVIFYLVIWISILMYHKSDFKRIKYLILGVILLAGGFLYLYFFASDLFVRLFGSSFFYRMDRVVGLFTSNYQLEQALLNMGVAGLTGHHGILSIPEATTDFAFALLVSLNGLIGTLLFLLVNLLLNLLILNKIKDGNPFMKSITFAFLMMKLFQENIHMLMNIGLFPITGITLPFISYGGTSLLSYFFIVGFISNYHKDNIPA